MFRIDDSDDSVQAVNNSVEKARGPSQVANKIAESPQKRQKGSGL